MLVSKRIIESVLPDNLKQLIEECSLENLNTVAENLQLSLEHVKNEINVLRETSIETIEPEIRKAENFIDQINNLHKQIDNINKDLDEQENLLKNVSQIEEYKSLIDNIETINKIVIIFEALREYELNLNGNFFVWLKPTQVLFENLFFNSKDLKYSIDSKNFVQCYDCLNKLNKLTNESNLFKTSQLQHDINENFLRTDEILIVKDLKEEFTIQRERLWYELDLEWDKLIQIDSNQIQIDIIGLNQSYLNQLTQFSGLKSASQIGEINFVFSTKLKSFSKSLLKLIETRIINSNQIIQIDTKTDSNFTYLTFNLTNSTTSSETSLLLELKLNQIITIFNFMYKNFLSLKVFINNMTKNVTSNVSLMSIFSHVTNEDFSKLIYESLIVNILPLKEYDCSIHEKFGNLFSQFEENLRTIEFCKESNKMLNTLDNLEEMYVRKKCKSIMETARYMMKNQDLMFELVNTEDLRINLNDLKGNKLIDDLKHIYKQTQEKSGFFKIPRFSISKFAQQFLNLINETLKEASKLSDENNKSLKSVTLFCLVTRNLFDLYYSVIPTQYSSSLKDLPKLSAIVFNDFYYLSLNCLTIGHKYKNLIHKVKESTVNLGEFRYVDLHDLISNFNYVELAPDLYMLGYEILANQVQNQEKNLIQYLYEDCPNGIKDISESNNYETFKRSLQKCIFQLKMLSSMWRNVLNEDLFNVVIGQLIDLVLKDLVKSCLKLEDISSNDASYLHSAFTVMTQTIHDLYTKNSASEKTENLSNDLVNLSLNTNLADLEACKYVSSWQKFKHLLVILKASLQEIVDLWTDGKGPLAMHYEPEEIRYLIKALFMNTDRRQAALAKIK
ncbi:unnamed protein product [Brachionus calyciflorus]|uniref:Centromere/kinetochore protein zw10-like protein n=1 Tax=Brachionus calyciflorus TaxID=104777 RepID=A0A813PKT9_9BILA|nr:unnamed protein product [Brachionus calyciflorus]